MTRRAVPLHIYVESVSVRGTEIYRDGVWSHPELIAECQAALIRPIATPLTPPAPVAREERAPAERPA